MLEAKINFRCTETYIAYPEVNTIHLGYKNQLVSTAKGHNGYLFQGPYKTHKCPACAAVRSLEC